MNKILYMVASFILGAAITAIVFVKVLSQTMYDAGSSDLNEKLEFSKVVDISEDEKTKQAFYRLLCSRADWLKHLGDSYLNTPNKIDLELIAIVERKCISNNTPLNYK
ncbi:hypothetical protein [Thalassotalea sp. PLHSN55]|uniref:hypothetical protein n=1 Tax=Thalassotalea sp. PLHSN55 TaxID=3435888 RepID=UPI003F853F8B